MKPGDLVALRGRFSIVGCVMHVQADASSADVKQIYFPVLALVPAMTRRVPTWYLVLINGVCGWVRVTQ